MNPSSTFFRWFLIGAGLFAGIIIITMLARVIR